MQPDKFGHYTVMLGSASSQKLPADLFTAGEPSWVGVRPQGQPEQTRVMLVSVPYALKSRDAETVGVPSSAFVLAQSQAPANRALGRLGGEVLSLPIHALSEITFGGEVVGEYRLRPFQLDNGVLPPFLSATDMIEGGLS